MLKLSPTEQRIHELIAEGKANKEIGTEMNMKEGTVKFHASNIYMKLGVRNRTEAAMKFIRAASCIFILIATLFASPLEAQGTVTISASTVIVGTSGNVSCTLTLTNPLPTAGIQVTCVVTNAGIPNVTNTQSATISSASTGFVGAQVSGSNNVTWIVSQPTATGPLSWQMAANGTSKSGSF